MDAHSLLKKHFSKNSLALDIVLSHSRLVADKALSIASRLDAAIDKEFIEQASLLHDIGICRTNAKKIGCTGGHPYIMHGIIGREILEKEGLTKHALVCERHIGVGITKTDIASQRLPLPLRDMIPMTIEEEIISFADLFFSKTPGRIHHEKTVAEVRNSLLSFGDDKAKIFDQLVQRFCSP